jgi:hypothetical protein
MHGGKADGAAEAATAANVSVNAIIAKIFFMVSPGIGGLR